MIPITNVAGTPHVTPKQDAMFHRGMAGADNCVYNFLESFEPEVSSNQKIKARSGIGQLQGRLFCIEPSTYDEIQIANGTQGEKRIDLIVVRWTVNEEKNTQTADWVVIQGESTTGIPVAPAYTNGNLDAGDTVADMPMYEVSLDGINVTGVTKRFTVLSGLGKLVSDETIQMFKDAGYPITGGVTLDKIIQDLITSGITQTYEQDGWRIKKYADGTAEAWKTNSTASANGFLRCSNPFRNAKSLQIYTTSTYFGSNVGIVRTTPQIQSLSDQNFIIYVRMEDGTAAPSNVYEFPIYAVAKL